MIISEQVEPSWTKTTHVLNWTIELGVIVMDFLLSSKIGIEASHLTIFVLQESQLSNHEIFVFPSKSQLKLFSDATFILFDLKSSMMYSFHWHKRSETN